jgi:hypothetical protein
MAVPSEPEEPTSPEALREGVRSGIVGALSEERERTAVLVRGLAVAGAAGVAGAVALTLLFAGEADHALHLAVCGAVWAGLLVECFAFALLRIRMRRLPLGQVAALGLVGLGLALCFVLLCPDPHVWRWWDSTAIGAVTRSLGGDLSSALSFGLCSALFLGLGATLVVVARGARIERAGPSALALTLLLAPAVILQTADASAWFMAAWGVGTASGAYLGVAAGLALAVHLKP